MTYLTMAVVVGIAGVLFWASAYLYFKKNPEKYRGLSGIVAFLLLGPMLLLMISSMEKRGYGVSRRELWGLAAVMVLMLAAIVASVLFGVGVRGR